MILGFKTHFQDGTPTNFRDKILKGIKQTTIRTDPNDRYQVGTKLHFATGVRTKNYECFAEGRVEKIWKIKISPKEQLIRIIGNSIRESMVIHHGSNYANLLIADEGFDCESQFWKWFNKPMAGKLIHWRLFR